MKKTIRLKKHLKVRKNISGTKERPRLSVYRSGKHIYAQLIDDSIGKTLIAQSDIKLEKNPKTPIKSGKTDKAYQVGKNLALAAKKLKIQKVVFDRGGFLYHGRIEKLAQGAREEGLEF